MAEEAYPTARPIGIESDRLGEREARECNPRATAVPWIDAHQHTQTLSWNDQHKFSLSGCQAAVMIAANYHWSPYRPVKPEDVRFLWDLAIKWTDYLDANHLFETHVAVAVHTIARVTDAEDLVERMRNYCDLEKVVAIGETGIEPVQYASRWPIEEQRPVVRAQMRVADDAGLPVILHTPTKKSTDDASSERGWGGLGLSEPDPAIDYSRPKLEAVEIDVELMDEAGINDERVLVDHADPSIVEFVMESTDCYLGFSVSSPLKGVTPEDVADAIHTYGPDRIILDSDMMGYRDCDFYCIPRTLGELHRLGVPVADLRTIAYENPKEILGLDYL